MCSDEVYILILFQTDNRTYKYVVFSEGTRYAILVLEKNYETDYTILITSFFFNCVKYSF